MSELTDNVAEQALAAAQRIQSVIRETPLVRSESFSDELGADVWFKLENEQYTGSFKLRGASNCLLGLDDEQKAQGVVTASSGNHGAGVAYAMHELGVRGVVFVPEQTSDAKLEKIRDLGAEVRFFGTDGVDTERHARSYAAEQGMYYVSPYNDAAVIAGQGTCGVEIMRQLPDVDTAFIAVGGGGLISGVGSVLKRHNPQLELLACQPSASAVMTRSIEAGRILDLPSEPTLSDGTAGGVEQGSITFELCRQLVDEWLLVDEAAIAAAMRRYIDSEGHAIEGAAGVAIAALLARKGAVAGRKIVVIICGGNIAAATLEALVATAVPSGLPVAD